MTRSIAGSSIELGDEVLISYFCLHFLYTMQVKCERMLSHTNLNLSKMRKMGGIVIIGESMSAKNVQIIWLARVCTSLGFDEDYHSDKII